jgi:hypothetical protein
LAHWRGFPTLAPRFCKTAGPDPQGKGHSKGKRSQSPKRPFLVTGSAFNLPADVGTLISRDRQLLRCFFAERLNCDIGGHFKGFEAIPKTHATYESHESHESYATQSRVADHRMCDDRLFAGAYLAGPRKL